MPQQPHRRSRWWATGHIIGLLYVLAGLSACGSSSPPPLPTAQPGSWPTSWLTDARCRAPCWEQITPGHTTAAAALTALRQQPFITRVMTSTIAQGLDVMTWAWSEQPDVVAGRAYYYTDAAHPGQIVFTLGVIYPRTVRLSDVLQSYGPPGYIQAMAQQVTPHTTGQTPDAATPGIRYSLTLIYLSQGLQLILADQESSRPVLAPDMPVHSLTFDDPATDAFRNADLQTLAAAGVVPWRGFLDFASYCMDPSGSQACQAAP